MMSMLFLFALIFTQVYGIFLLNPESSSFIVLRHLRISTDNEQYYIGCPDDLNHITLRLLNYSNENCFNLYSTSNICVNHISPCKFHAEPVQLHCNQHSYSNHVDITYQCSYNKETISSTLRRDTFTLHPLSTNSEESIALFLIGLSIVIVLWILFCCICFIHCHHDDEKCELLSYQSYPKEDENLCLHVNPFENNHISSLITTHNV